MKLMIYLTVIWALCSTAGALQCLRCNDLQCSSTVSVNCSTETMCVSASLLRISSGIQSQQMEKGCASSLLCPSTGSHNFSVSGGSLRIIASAECCSTNNCNNETVPGPQIPAVNSLQCFGCNNATPCDSTVQCRGNEERCFQASVMTGSGTAATFGCTSANLCAAADQASEFFSNITFAASCCETSLCNTVTAATPTTASDACCFKLCVIHLLLVLLIFTFS